MNRTSIKVFSPNIDLLGEIDLFSSLIFNKSYNDTETDFQIITEVNKVNISILDKNNLIMVNNDVEKVGIIKYVKIDLDEEGNEILLIKGFTINNILNDRIVYISSSESETKFAGNSVDLIERLLNENLINPIDENRKIDNLIMDIDKSLGKDILWQLSSSKHVGDTISEICKITNLGFKIYLDLNTRKLVFKLCNGKDLSDKVVFDPLLDNIKNMRYINSSMDYKNTAYIQTVNAGVTTINKHTEVLRKGIELQEGFYNKGEIGADENYEEVISEYFNNNQLVESIEGDITSTSLFTYKKDFNLGDIVTVRNKKWGVTKYLRITSIAEVYEQSPKMTFIFGEAQPTLAKKIRSYIANITY